MKKILLIAIAAMSFGWANAAQKPENTIVLGTSQGFQGPEIEKNTYNVDKKGYIVLFDGTSLKGWRGYGKNHVPVRWEIEDGTLHFIGHNNPKYKDEKGNKREGGDLIFAHNFKNFIFEIEWKISKGGNSGIFYLAQETTNADRSKLEPIYISCPEYQVLDNENHPDAKLGKDNNRKAASLYDMIPAKPQDAKPYGNWNKAKIVVQDGKITHYQNGAEVLTYNLWTPEWIKLLQDSKFSEKKWPHAYQLLSNCGGKNHEGFVGIQDHGDDVWYRNIKIKVLE
jgi:hypothetical protein